MSNQEQGLLSHFYIGFVCFVPNYTRPRYQVSVYRTIGPLVFRLDLFSKLSLIFTKIFRNTIRMSNSLDNPDQTRRFVRPDLRPNCLHAQ